MHPAKSIILFTTLSGMGNGLLAFLCLGIPDVSGWTAFIFFAIAFAMAGGGLLASTFHLGHPERFLKAFTQWRSSWLSREGVLACVTFAFTGLYALLVIFFDTRIMLLGWIGSALAVATVYATSMIYAQLKTVPRWNHWTTSALFVGLALAGGALLSGTIWLAILLILACGVLQFYAWNIGDNQLKNSGSSIESATGLGNIGSVRAFESPHTGGNYLTHEMVFVLARKHAMKLRVIALVLAFLLPVVFLLMPFSHMMAVLAIASHLAGLFVVRWLFFAEAEHVVGLYYGQR